MDPINETNEVVNEVTTDAPKTDYAFVKILADRNEPKISFGEPKFTQYSYVDKEDGRKRIVVKCEIESRLTVPMGIFRDLSAGTEEFVTYPSGTVIKTVGKAVCDERDEEVFSYTLGQRVSRVRAEKKAFEKHSKALKARMAKLLDFYNGSFSSFMAKAEKVAADEIIWEEKGKTEE